MPLALSVQFPASGGPGVIESTGPNPPPNPTEPLIRRNTATGIYEGWDPVAATWSRLVPDDWVDEAGDVMTGDLDMSNNDINNARLTEGTF